LTIPQRKYVSFAFIGLIKILQCSSFDLHSTCTALSLAPWRELFLIHDRRNSRMMVEKSAASHPRRLGAGFPKDYAQTTS
jgi:hypothetical protein